MYRVRIFFYKMLLRFIITFLKIFLFFWRIIIRYYFQYVKLRHIKFFLFENLYEFFSMKIFLLCTAISSVFCCILMNLELDLLIFENLEELSFLGLSSSNVFLKLTEVSIYFLVLKSIIYTLLFFHSLFALVSLIYDYSLKRLFLKHKFILGFISLSLLQFSLKSIFLIIL